MARAVRTYRIWAYLALAAAMLAVPLVRYVDSTETLAALALGVAALTLFAYGEVFAAVRRGTRVLRAIFGQPDLMMLANVNVSTARREVLRELWHDGGWAGVGALLVGRFALGLALAQYLYLFHLSVPGGILARPFNLALGAVTYISHNGASNAGGSWDIPLYQPLWWQRVFALCVLLVVLLVEMWMMAAVATALYVRPRRMHRWVMPSAVAFRIVLGGAALAAIVGLSMIPTVGGYHWLRADVGCLEEWRLNGRLTPACAQAVGDMQRLRAVEGTQAALVALFDGGVLLTANIMRANLNVTHTGEGLEYRRDITYHVVPGSYPPRPWTQWRDRVSPLLPMLRMAVAAAVPMLAMLLIAVVADRQTARRCAPQPSSRS